MKSYLEIIGAFIAVSALALAAIWIAPAKADPLSDFFEAIFERQASLPPYNAHWRRFHARPSQKPAGAAPVGSMLASYYGGGRRERLNAHTASGERFDPNGFTAAHRSLRFGTMLSVCFHGCATVRVNDRGPSASTGRSLDLSRGAARAIGMISAGVARVRVAQLGVGQ